jgi:hypothetical protein
MIVRADADGQGGPTDRVQAPYLLRDPKRSVAKRMEAGVREPARDREQRRPWLVLGEELLGDPVERRI